MRRWIAVAGAAVACTAAPPATGTAEARSCPDFRVGPHRYNDVEARGVTCARARTLLDRGRRAALPALTARWSASGWRWRAPGADDITRRLIGKRGSRTVEAWWVRPN